MDNEWWLELHWLRDHLATLPDDHPLHKHIANLHSEVGLLRAIANNVRAGKDYYEATRKMANTWEHKMPIEYKEPINPRWYWQENVEWGDDESD